MEENSLRWFLEPEEMLLWEGAPEEGLPLKAADWLTILFFLVSCGLLIGILSGVLKKDTFLISLILTGIFQFVLIFFIKPFYWKGTRYAVTDRRVIVMRRRETVSMTYQQIPVVFKEFQKDGTGTLWFKQPAHKTGNYKGLWKEVRYYVPGVGFQNIADPEWVCRLIETQIQRTQRR